jgi:hypothetical protein
MNAQAVAPEDLIRFRDMVRILAAGVVRHQVHAAPVAHSAGVSVRRAY